MTRQAPSAVAELIGQLSAGAISIEEFLWGAAAAGVERREAARHAVGAAATATPGSRSVGVGSGAGVAPGKRDSETSHVTGAPGVSAASVASTASGASAASGAGGVLRVGLWLPVDGMDPAISTYRTSRLATEQLYSTLMALGPDGRPYPDLAEWIDVSEDAQTYTFGIVPGVRFHDGSPLTADDVAFTFRRLLKMGEAYHFDPWIATIAGADVVDPLTVRIRLTQPTGPILTWLAFCGTGIVPRVAVDAGRDLNREPVGSGPFRLAQPWGGTDSGESIVLTRHDASARGGRLFTPRLAGIEFTAIPAAADRVAALREGRIDLDALLGADDFAAVAEAPGLVAHETPDSRWHWLVVNCRQAPLGDTRVRRAIALAVDRRELLDAGFVGLGTPIGAGVIAPWSWAAAPDLNGFGPTADPAAARALLADAGVAVGTPLVITAMDSLGIAIRQAELIAGQLRAVGLGARVNVVDGSAWGASVSREGDFQLATSYWGSPIWDPDDFVWMGFRSGARYDSGSCSSPALDEWMDRGRGTVVQSERRAAYQALQALAVEQLPVIPTIQPAMLRGTTARLRGYVPTPCAQLRTLRDAWLED